METVYGLLPSDNSEMSNFANFICKFSECLSHKIFWLAELKDCQQLLTSLRPVYGNVFGKKASVIYNPKQ